MPDMDREQVVRALAMHAALIQMYTLRTTPEDQSVWLQRAADANVSLIRNFALGDLTKPKDPFS